MATIKGQNLRVLLGTSASNLKCISVAKSCVLHVSAQVGEAASKDSPSEWQEQEITAINWDVQADALITTTADGGVLQSENVRVNPYKVRTIRGVPTPLKGANH